MPNMSARSSLRGSLADIAEQGSTLWHARESAGATYKCVPTLVSERASATPNGTALTRGEDVLTYAELNARSNRLARHLRSLGVGPDVLVGLYIPRSPALAVGALGVMKAGGAYVPFDPACPLERIAWMLNDAQPAVLLTQQRLAQRLPAGNWRTLNLDGDGSRIASNSAEPVESGVRVENLAYVIYTSGSTGKPKGVQIAHDSLLNLVFWHQQAFDVRASDRASQLASPGFDAAVWELWPYLSAGASVHFADDAIRGEPESLRDWMVSNSISIGFVPTPLAERMITLEWPRETALRLLLTGADTLRSYPPSNLPFTLVNNYGPTECTVVATSGPVLSNGHRDALPGIGRPISNVQIYILNEQLEHVRVGTPGEIYIGGAGVARGYLNAPELNAAKFIAHPFESAAHGRLYKTGDLGCYLPDGQIAFRGRIDDQIKIRGYRIEPNEIITALAKHPMVQASTVIACDDTAGDKQLVAYVVPGPDCTPTDQLLREFLRSQLPEHMIPAVFVRMNVLPLNANGKVDRAALPAPDDSNSLRADGYVAPRTPIEQRMAEILAPLLGLERVSVEDNFFMLGGHSLLGTQVIARTRETFGVKLSLRSLFDSPTIAALAAEVERLLYVCLEAMSEEEAEHFLKRAIQGSAGGM